MPSNTKKARTMAVKEPPTTKVVIDRFWLSIGIPAMIWVFSAGIGWNRLSYAEDTIKELRQTVEAIKTDKYDTVAKLTAVSLRLEELVRNTDKLSSQLETFTKTKPPG